MENILDKLNEEQREAVKTTQGPLLILAGAGSGKTRVLTTRIAYMIQNGAIAGKILAVTFTNKAAREMKERLASILGDNIVKYMWVGTFHSICGRILRQDIENYKFQSGKKLDKNFTIYDETDSLAVIKQAIKKLNLDDKIYQPKLVKSVISNAKNKMQDAYTFATFAKDFKSQKIAQIFEQYENTLNNNNAIDFDDMLMLCVKLLEQNPEVRKKYFNKFQHILVDEYQDTNIAQYNLVNALYTNLEPQVPKERSLCVVGDVDQSIYSWRGADFRIIMNFQRDFPNAKVIKLEQNYRSTANILDAANSVIENNEERVDKVLYSQKGDGEKITYYEAQDEADEANYIVKSIVSTSDNYNQFAILYRTNAQSRALEEALISAGVPYRIYGGLKFYDRKEIKDILCYARILINPADNVSLLRIINTPTRGLGKVAQDRLSAYAEEKQIPLYEALRHAPYVGGLSSVACKAALNLAKLFDGWRQDMLLTAPADIFNKILQESGYLAAVRAEMEKDPEAESRLQNLDALVNAVKEYEERCQKGEKEPSVSDFLQEISLLSGEDNSATVVEGIADAARFAEEVIGAAHTYEIPAAAYITKADAIAKKGTLLMSKDACCEGKRCLQCHTVCENCVDSCPNRANVAVVMPDESHQIIHVDKMCNECGNCTQFCPYASEPCHDKFTLFQTKEDMDESENYGVLFEDDDMVRLRYEDGVKEYDLASCDNDLPVELEALILTVRDKYSYLYA